jgi:hypothetical protein
MKTIEVMAAQDELTRQEKWPAVRLPLLTGLTHLSRKRVPVAKPIILSSGPINGGGQKRSSQSSLTACLWQSESSGRAQQRSPPAHYLEVASAAMRLLAEAHDFDSNPSEPTAITALSAACRPRQPVATISWRVAARCSIGPLTRLVTARTRGRSTRTRRRPPGRSRH